MELLQPNEIEQIERDHAAGLRARAIVEIFRPRGVQLSEATFRKYVQVGLLPQSRRVGRKGKHRGSQGLYPVESVRRINAIKKMMAEGQTLEDIKGSFMFFKSHIDQVDRELHRVLDGFETALAGWPARPSAGKTDPVKRDLLKQLHLLRVWARELVRDVSRFGSAVTAKRGGEVFVQL